MAKHKPSKQINDAALDGLIEFGSKSGYFARAEADAILSALIELRGRRLQDETSEDEGPCVSHVAMKGYERVLGEIRDHSTDKWAAGLAREAIGPAVEPALRHLTESERASFERAGVE